MVAHTYNLSAYSKGKRINQKFKAYVARHYLKNTTKY